MYKLVYIALSLVFLTISIWLILRIYYPDIFKVKGGYEKCDQCKKGFLEPQFKWWRYFFFIILPPTIVIIFGRPDGYICSLCHYKTKKVKNMSFFTRIYMNQKLPVPFIFLIIGGSFAIIILHVLFS